MDGETMAEMPQLYIWLDGEPGISEPDATIDDVPGEVDLQLIADAVAAGKLGSILPVTLQVATQPDPAASRVRSIDVARLLRTYKIRHRRRYEVFSEADQA